MTSLSTPVDSFQTESHCFDTAKALLEGSSVVFLRADRLVVINGFDGFGVNHAKSMISLNFGNTTVDSR